jgi:hypothetical protein
VYGKHKNSLTRLSKCALRGCQIPLSRLSNIALRHSQIPITTLVIITHNRNRNVNRYYIRNCNDIRNVTPHTTSRITSRKSAPHRHTSTKISRVVTSHHIRTSHTKCHTQCQSLSHITYAIAMSIVVAHHHNIRITHRYPIRYITSRMTYDMTHHHMAYDPSHHMTQSSIVIVNRQGTMGYLMGNPHTHTHHYIPSTHPLT